MQEMYELPAPLSNYQGLVIRKKKDPYHRLISQLFEEMNAKHKSQGDFIYVPDIEKLLEKTNYELSKITIMRSILAWVKTAGLSDEEFYTTTTAGGCKRYHIKVNERTLNLLGRLL